MNVRWQRYVITVVIVFIAGIPCGCWNLREPENLAHVLAVAFDLDEETGFFRVYAQVANTVATGGGTTSEGGAGGMGTQGKKPYWVVSARGVTPFQAVRNLAPLVSRELFWAHTEVLLISERLARMGILPVFDLFERDRQVREIIQPVVVQGDIKTLMETDFPLEQTGAKGLSRGITVSTFQSAVFPVKSLIEPLATLSEPGWEMLIGRIEVLAKDNSESGISKPPVKISGAAVFHEDRMVDWLSERETTGWLWISGRVLRTTLVLLAPDSREKFVTVEVTASSGKIEPVIEGEDVRIKVTVKAEGRIENETGPLNLALESEVVHSLNRRMAQVIRNDMEMAIAKAQSLQADIFGFGHSIYRTHYRDWVNLEDRWPEIFSRVPVELDVRTSIRRTGLTGKSVTIR